jgi:RNA-binding protein PNO1
MVVAHIEASTSGVQRKNRRRMTKKKATTLAGPLQDEEMQTTNQTSVTDIATKPEKTNSPGDEDDELMIETDAVLPSPSAAPSFQPLPASAQRSSLKSEIRRIPIPPHRMTPLQKDWVNIFGPLTELLGLQVRMNTQRKSVEIRVSNYTYVEPYLR